MVSIKGVKGFVPLVENIETTPQQRYFQTANDRLKLREAQKRYELTDKGKERMIRYHNKPFHCDIGNLDMKINYKSQLCKTTKHLSKLV